MNILQYLLLVIVINLGFLFPMDNAYPLEEGKRQMGIFQPRVYGMKNNVEVSTHPILFFIKPNIKLKKFYREINGFGLASRYSFDYPTFFLKFIKRDGTGGFLADDPTIGEGEYR